MVGQAHGTVASQCVRKTILTSEWLFTIHCLTSCMSCIVVCSLVASHWFPHVKKRILIIDQQQFELSPIEVTISCSWAQSSLFISVVVVVVVVVVVCVCVCVCVCVMVL